MASALRDYAQALHRAAAARCDPPRRGAERCEHPICRVAALHQALARHAWRDLEAELDRDAEVQYFGIRLPGFARVARGADAAVELLRRNDGAMRWQRLELESATSLGDSLVLFRTERGRWSAPDADHAALVVTHFLLRDTRIARIRARAFPWDAAGSARPAGTDGSPGSAGGGAR